MTSWLTLFQTRKNEEELMDLPSTSRPDFTQALYDIQWVNKNLGGTEALLQELIRLIPEKHRGPLSILDLGTGSADIPIALIQWAYKSGIAFKITAVDLHPIAVEIARQLCQEYPEIEVIQADALHIPDADDTYDFVISSMFMHHLQHEQAVRLLQEMSRLCRIGFIINDLERHPLAWLGIKTLGFLTGKGRIFKNDAPLSVLRGFTQEDLLSLRHDAQLPDLRIQHKKPYRWILSWEKAHRHPDNPPPASQSVTKHVSTLNNSHPIK